MVGKSRWLLGAVMFFLPACELVIGNETRIVIADAESSDTTSTAEAAPGDAVKAVPDDAAEAATRDAADEFVCSASSACLVEASSCINNCLKDYASCMMDSMGQARHDCQMALDMCKGDCRAQCTACIACPSAQSACDGATE